MPLGADQLDDAGVLSRCLIMMRIPSGTAVSCSTREALRSASATRAIAATMVSRSLGGGIDRNQCAIRRVRDQVRASFAERRLEWLSVGRQGVDANMWPG